MPSGGFRPPGAPSADPAIADKAEKKQGRSERARGLAGKAGARRSDRADARGHGGSLTVVARRRQAGCAEPGLFAGTGVFPRPRKCARLGSESFAAERGSGEGSSMNFVFFSPHFPANGADFCDRLRKAGATVLGIGDAPYVSLSG